MKKYAALTLGLVSITLFLFSLHTKKPSNFSSTESLIGKWGIAGVVTKRVENGKTVLTKKYTGRATDYMTFGNNHRIYLFIENTKDIFSYIIMKENKILCNADTAIIKKLTPDICELSFRNEDSKNTYNEKIITLKK